MVEAPAGVVAGWLSSGSEIAYWATTEGEDPRAVPLDSRFHQHLTTAQRAWTGGSVLRVIPLAEPWQVLHFWNADGTFAGWYVNLESEKRRDRLGLVAVDWHLDVLISADFEAEWKDEDEAAAAVKTEYLRDEDLDHARRTGEAIMADPRSFIDALGRWDVTHSPAVSEPALTLPVGWDVL
ncbi:DUF402 domain-containing protein [Microbacterium foliorum]|nr:DUF402 domain-containing protein [Microbacterium foliorum]